MPRVLVPLAAGFEEIEAVTLIDVLRRADVEVVSAGLEGRQVTGSHGITLTADAMLDQVLEEDFDLIALPGGLPGAEHLKQHAGLRQRLQTQVANQRPVAAICAAPMVLNAAGLLSGQAATSYPGFLEDADVDYQESAVVVDSGLTTSRSPATALVFALKLVEQLAGADKRAELQKKMLFEDQA